MTNILQINIKLYNLLKWNMHIWMDFQYTDDESQCGTCLFYLIAPKKAIFKIAMHLIFIGMFAVTSQLWLVGREATTVTRSWPGKSVVLTRVSPLPELIF